MPLRQGSPQTRRRGCDASVFFSWEMSRGSRGGQTTGLTQNQANAYVYAKSIKTKYLWFCSPQRAARDVPPVFSA
jgi:hypothetical protein